VWKALSHTVIDLDDLERRGRHLGDGQLAAESVGITSPRSAARVQRCVS
jgi:hypothetical protein